MNNAWTHDYPRAEQNLASILRELTLIDVNPEGRILRYKLGVNYMIYGLIH